MFTTGPDRSPYDLNFRLLGFPVQVQPIFWVLALITGFQILNVGFDFFFAWVAILFGSILLHEMGHGFAFRAFGVDARLMLTGFGGLAVPDGHVRGSGRRILVSLAGPAIQLALYGVLFLFRGSLLEMNDSRLWAFFLLQLMFVNLVWPLLNLLPIWPLDGGQVAKELCQRANFRSGELVAYQIGMATAGLFVAWSLVTMFGLLPPETLAQLPWWLPRGQMLTILIFGYLAVMNFQMYQQARQTSHWRNDPY